MSGSELAWVLDEFNRKSGRYCGSYTLYGLSDYDARRLLGLKELGIEGLYDVPESSLGEISTRFGLEISPEKCEYLLGLGTVFPS